MEEVHEPVLLHQTIQYLNCIEGGVYCDGTIGLGGHAEAMLEVTPPIGKLIGIDLDSLALEKAKKRLERFGERALLIQGNFKDLPAIRESYHLPQLDGILLDLGLSSYQLFYEKRGFSFSEDAPLNMNFDSNEDKGAAYIVNTYSEVRLADIIWKYGQERRSRQIARRIIEERKKKPIEIASRLAEIVCSAIPGSGKRWRIHPATRTFQALRIEVNHELENLKEFLMVAEKCIQCGGRMCIISFHSLEDRIVKMHFRDLSSGKIALSGERQVTIMTKKPIAPDPEEMRRNPRSRSAKLRVAEWH